MTAREFLDKINDYKDMLIDMVYKGTYYDFDDDEEDIESLLDKELKNVDISIDSDMGMEDNISLTLYVKENR